MKALLVTAIAPILCAIGAFAQAPAVTIKGIDGLSHSVVRLTYNISGTAINARTRYTVSPATCTGGSGGTVQLMSQAGYFTTGMRVVVGGLTPNTTYQICPEVTADNVHWSSGVGVSVTTLPLPPVHPAPPIPPVTFNTSYPDTTGYAVQTVASDCSDYQAKINAAVRRAMSRGTILNIPAGTVCSSGAPYQITVPSPDTIAFASSAVSIATSSIKLPAHGLTEGQTVVFGSSFSGLPASVSCVDGSGFAEQGIVLGQLYPIHVVDANTIQIYCDKPASAGGKQMIFINQSSGSNLYIRPEPDPKLKWVIVRTATPDGQFAPEHTRITPAWVPKMASFVQPLNKFSNSTPQNSLFDLDNSDGNVALPISNIRLVGLEFTVADDSLDTATSTDPNFWWRTIIVHPWNQNVVFDRCYVHGRGTPSRISHGFYWDGHNTAVVDSYFEHLEYFHAAYTGLSAKGKRNKFAIAPGTHHMGAITATLSSPVTVTLSGSGTGASFVYFDFNRNLKVSLPPDVTGSCSGCTIVPTYKEANGTNGEGDVFPATPVTGGNIYIDPMFSTASTGGTITTLNTADPVEHGYLVDGRGLSRGTRFYSDTNGYIQGVRFYKHRGDKGTHTVSLWTNTGTLLATQRSIKESPSGWQSVTFSTAVPITANTHYVASAYCSVGARYYAPGMFENTDFGNAPLHAVTPYAGNIGGCNTSSDWPRNAFGNPAAGEIACVNISNGSIANVVNADATSSTYITEGSNFMIGGSGPGPYEVLNTFIEGAGLTWHHDEGGGDARVRNDYTYNRDTFLLKPSHMFQTAGSDGLYYAVRHLLEWKSGGRIAITGSLFDGATSEDTPIGDFFEIASDNGGGAHDVLIQDNTFQHGPAGFFAPGIIAGSQIPQGPPPVRLTVKNNLFWDIDGKYHSNCCFGGNGGKGWILADGGTGEEDTVFDHNTVLHNTGVIPSLWYMTDTRHEGVQFTNNFLYLSAGDWGFRSENIPGCPSAQGKATADCVFTGGYRFDHNVLMSDASQAEVRAQWPSPLNYVPRKPSDYSAVGFFNYDGNPLGFMNGNPKKYNFRVKSNYCSRCGHAASDGADVGANIDTLDAAQGKVTLVGTPETGITSTSATVVFVAPDQAGCTVDYSSSDPTLINNFSRAPDPGGPRARNITLSGLTSGTVYHYRVNCAVEQPIGQFRTH